MPSPRAKKSAKPSADRLLRADEEQQRDDDRPDARRGDDAHREPHEERADRALADAARAAA